MSSHPLEGIMNVAMERIKDLVDSNTIVGEAISMPSGITIIPISKVSFGFGSGGSDFPTKTDKDLFGGGSGAGVSISPQGFLIVNNTDVKFIQVDTPPENTADRVVSAIPEVMDKLQDMFSKKETSKKTEE